jgi:ribonuclease HI
VAEYLGVSEAMKWLNKNSKKLNGSEIDFYLDSQLVVKQLNGEYKIKNMKLIQLAKEIKRLQKNIDNKINFNFVKRDKNKIADRLLNEKLDETMADQ